MTLKAFAAFSAALIVISLAAMPVDAATSKKRAHQSQMTTTATPPSLIWDRRVLGRPRTCGFDYMQYDGFGVPTGPYCH